MFGCSLRASGVSAASGVSYRGTLGQARSIRQRCQTKSGSSLVVKRSFSEKNRSVPGTEAAIVAGAEEEGGGWAAGQRPHSLPVVRSFRAFWRFWMAVPTSSYCRALPAYLQNLCALVKSSADSCTPPAGSREEERQRRLAAPPLAGVLTGSANRESVWGPPPVRFWGGGGGEKPPFYLSISASLIPNSNISCRKSKISHFLFLNPAPPILPEGSL